MGDLGSICGSGRSPGEGNGNPFQYSCLENPMAREPKRTHLRNSHFVTLSSLSIGSQFPLSPLSCAQCPPEPRLLSWTFSREWACPQDFLQRSSNDQAWNPHPLQWRQSLNHWATREVPSSFLSGFFAQFACFLSRQLDFSAVSASFIHFSFTF